MAQLPSEAQGRKSADPHLRKKTGGWTRLRQAAPPWRQAVPGALVWALVMSVSAALNLVWRGWQSSDSIRDVALVFAGGGAVAFPVALTAATLMSSGRRGETRFAAACVALTLATIAVTALVFGLEYRAYYAQWHAAAFSITWTFQLFFTGLVSTVQFAVSGLPLYFPLGFAAIPVAALWFARLRR